MNVCRHELGHALAALQVGFRVQSITIGADHGENLIRFPVQPETLRQCYGRIPEQATAWLVGVVAVLRAGSFAEIWEGRLGEASTGPDAEALAAWQQAAEPLYGRAGWQQVYATACNGLRDWFKHRAVVQLMAELAPWVAQQRRIYTHAIRSIAELAAALPPLRLVPVLPARQQASSTPARRPALRLVEREAAPEGVPANFGRNPDGSVRTYFTKEELDYAADIMRRVQRRRVAASR
jgi:hypothetical protein